MHALCAEDAILQPAIDEIHRRRANESSDKAVGRTLVTLLRTGVLHDLARMHDHEPVGKRHRFLLVVRDIHDRRAELAVQRAQLAAGFDA